MGLACTVWAAPADDEPNTPKLDSDFCSISQRISSALSTAGSSFGPTQTQRQDCDIAQTQFTAIQAEIQQCINTDMVTLQKKLEAAGLPWTSGRPLPVSPSTSH